MESLSLYEQLEIAIRDNTELKIETEVSTKKINSANITERLYKVIGYRLVDGNPDTSEVAFEIPETTLRSARSFKRSFKRQGCYRVDILEVASFVSDKELTFPEINHIEKNVSKFTPGVATFAENSSRLKDKRIVARTKMFNNVLTRRNNMTGKSIEPKIKIYSRLDNRLMFSGNEGDAARFIVSQNINIKEIAVYMDGKMYEKVIRSEPVMKKIKVIQTGPASDRELPNWFQCNIPMEDWTDAIRKEITETCEKIANVEPGTFREMRLGSGYFKPGMKEIFYFI